MDESKPKSPSNEQAAGAGIKTYHSIAQHFGDIHPGVKPNLDHYSYAPHEDKIDQLIAHHGYKSKIGGGKYGKFDLKTNNYNTKDLLIYDPTPASGGDFKDEATTRSWRKIHELSHALTYPEVNDKYGEGRRLGKLGTRSFNEAHRAVHWEWLAAHKQRELSAGLGVHISDQDFHKELNTVMHDAVHRAVHGKFTEPSDEGFHPSDKKIPLEHALDLTDRRNEDKQPRSAIWTPEQRAQQTPKMAKHEGRGCAWPGAYPWPSDMMGEDEVSKSEDKKKPMNDHAMPYHYGHEMAGKDNKQRVHVFHATSPAHHALKGEHTQENPSNKDYRDTIDKAVKNKNFTVIIHGAPPEQLRTRLSATHGVTKTGKLDKAEADGSPKSVEAEKKRLETIKMWKLIGKYHPDMPKPPEAQEAKPEKVLEKTFKQPDLKNLTDDKSHAAAMQSLPENLKEWGAEKLSALPSGAVEHFEIAGHKIKVHKKGTDQYSGWIIDSRTGDQKHEFNDLTMPQLMQQVQSKLDLYSKDALPVSEKLPDVGDRLKDLKTKIEDRIATPEAAVEGPEKSVDMFVDEIDQIEEQLKQFRKEIQDKHGPFPVEEVETIKMNQIAPKTDSKCEECGDDVMVCSCFAGFSSPSISIDLARKKLVVLFKSEWGEEDRSAFMSDLRRRGMAILRKKLGL